MNLFKNVSPIKRPQLWQQVALLRVFLAPHFENRGVGSVLRLRFEELQSKIHKITENKQLYLVYGRTKPTQSCENIVINFSRVCLTSDHKTSFKTGHLCDKGIQLFNLKRKGLAWEFIQPFYITHGRAATEKGNKHKHSLNAFFNKVENLSSWEMSCQLGFSYTFCIIPCSTINH